MPTFAYINGAAMGGGLELALHCTYRTVSSGVRAVSLPEVFLGFVPGWGGTHLLPNLVGLQHARSPSSWRTRSEQQAADGPQAYRLGIADAEFEPADFLEQSLLWTAQVLRGDVVVERPVVDRDGRVGRCHRPREIVRRRKDSRRGAWAVPRPRPPRPGPSARA